MWSICFSGRLCGDSPFRFETRRRVLTRRGGHVEVWNIVQNGNCGNRDVICQIHISNECPASALLMPCISQYNTKTPVADMYALPTWIQLVCKPHEFTMPEMEHAWDLIPVMVTVCIRVAMASIISSGMDDPHSRTTMTLLVDAFDQKYTRYAPTAQMAIDDMLSKQERSGSDTNEAMSYCMMIGAYLLVNFFEYEAYDLSDLWQSAIRHPETNRPSGLIFFSNMSDVRCKIVGWMCGVEDELRAKSAHASTIVQHISQYLKYTINVIEHYDTIQIMTTPHIDGRDGDSAPQQAALSVPSVPGVVVVGAGLANGIVPGTLVDGVERGVTVAAVDWV